MSGSIQSQVSQMANWTSQQEALKAKTQGTSNELNQDMFLKLMLEQLKYQDPLNPMDNQDFLAQQAQFTQLEELQQLNNNMSVNNSISQGMSLIGKEVTLVNPDNADQTITGVVEEAVFYTNGCAVKVNGKEYPASYITNAKVPATPNGQMGSSAIGTTDVANATYTASDIARSASYIANELL